MQAVWLQGLICNSSICMKRRGMAPTGIAIFSAQVTLVTSPAHAAACDACLSGDTSSVSHELPFVQPHF